MSKLTGTTTFALGLTLLAVAAQAADRHAADAQAVSASTLSELGLADLQPLSDRQGEQIRGRTVAVGTAGSPLFITQPNTLKPLLGVVEHARLKGGGHLTTIVNHPQVGTLIAPPPIKK